jgi:hypothetical protein
VIPVADDEPTGITWREIKDSDFEQVEAETLVVSFAAVDLEVEGMEDPAKQGFVFGLIDLSIPGDQTRHELLLAFRPNMLKALCFQLVEMHLDEVRDMVLTGEEMRAEFDVGDISAGGADADRPD